MNQTVPTPPLPFTIPKIVAPPRVTMGSVEIPGLELLAELSRRLPGEDGVPLESVWHRWAGELLADVLYYLWRGRTDFFVGCNMFVYYSLQRLRNADFAGPDFFYVSDVELNRPRKHWVVWLEEGKYPNVIIELISETTADEDRGPKKTLYEQTFHTPEYFCYDPATRRLEGWRLQGQNYKEITPDERGWMWSEVFQLWLGTWVGEHMGQRDTWPRFYGASGQLVPTGREAEAQRADTAEAELVRLRARLAELEKGQIP